MRAFLFSHLARACSPRRSVCAPLGSLLLLLLLPLLPARVDPCKGRPLHGALILSQRRFHFVFFFFVSANPCVLCGTFVMLVLAQKRFYLFGV